MTSQLKVVFHSLYRIENTTQLEHFNTWRWTYGPPSVRKLFSISTLYQRGEDGKRYSSMDVKCYVVNRKIKAEEAESLDAS